MKIFIEIITIIAGAFIVFTMAQIAVVNALENKKPKAPINVIPPKVVPPSPPSVPPIRIEVVYTGYQPKEDLKGKLNPPSGGTNVQ